jgi:hypothetical protein
VRRAWQKLGLWLLGVFGWERPFRHEIGTRTVFRGRKNQLLQPEWLELAEVFKRVPDLEDYLQIQLDNLDLLLRRASPETSGDRQRLVLTTQREVLLEILRLPDTATAKVREMAQPKRAPMKGTYAS